VAVGGPVVGVAGDVAGAVSGGYARPLDDARLVDEDMIPCDVSARERHRQIDSDEEILNFSL
jgi:hypothetical protein